MTLVLAGAALSASGSVPSSKLTWQVTYRQSSLDIQGVTAFSADDAWAYGTGDTRGGHLLHWNGSGWSTVRYPGQDSYQIYAAYPLSATDVWFAGTNEAAPYTARILHWQAGTWTWLAVPSEGNDAVVDVLGDDDIWSVGGSLAGCSTSAGHDVQGCTVTSQWDGAGWSSYPLAAVQGVAFVSSASGALWATGESYLRPGRNGGVPTFVQQVYRWTGTSWQRAAVSGKRADYATTLVVDSARNVWLAEPSSADPKACAMHWTGSTWHPFSLPGQGSLACAGAVTNDRAGFWTVTGPGDLAVHAFVFLDWTGTRLVATPGFAPSQGSYNTDGFQVAAVPHSSSVWIYGSYCAVSKVCRTHWIIARLR